MSYFLGFFEECELSCEQLCLFRIIVGFIGIGVGRSKAEASHLLIALTMFRFYFKSFIWLAAPVMSGKKKSHLNPRRSTERAVNLALELFFLYNHSYL